MSVEKIEKKIKKLELRKKRSMITEAFLGHMKYLDDIELENLLWVGIESVSLCTDSMDGLSAAYSDLYGGSKYEIQTSKKRYKEIIREIKYTKALKKTTRRNENENHNRKF